MQDVQFNRLVDTVLDLKPASLSRVKAKMKSIETANNKAFAKRSMPPDERNYERTPTAEELIQFRQWAIDYKKRMPKASKREVRRAVQEHFHIRLFK
jgi:hypothetical protein